LNTIALDCWELQVRILFYEAQIIQLNL